MSSVYITFTTRCVFYYLFTIIYYSFKRRYFPAARGPLSVAFSIYGHPIPRFAIPVYTYYPLRNYTTTLMPFEAFLISTFS